MKNKISALVLIFLIAGFANAQFSIVGAQISLNERIYHPGEIYEKTVYIIPNETYLSAGTTIDPYCVEPTKGYIIIQRVVFYGIFQYKSYPNEMLPLNTQMTSGVAIPITITWQIPNDIPSGTYIPAVQLGVIPCNTTKSKIMGFEGDYVIVDVPFTCATNKECQDRYKDCYQTCSNSLCHPVDVTYSALTYPSCGEVTTTTTTPSVTTTTYCIDFGIQLCPDGKTQCPYSGMTQYSWGYCPSPDCTKCPQPQNNVLIYVVLAIVLLIVIFSILKHYKKI